MDFALVEYVLSQSGLAVVAGLALWFMWQQQKEALRREERNSEIHRQDKLSILEALEDVTRSNTELCLLISEMREDIKERR